MWEWMCRTDGCVQSWWDLCLKAFTFSVCCFTVLILICFSYWQQSPSLWTPNKPHFASLCEYDVWSKCCCCCCLVSNVDVPPIASVVMSLFCNLMSIDTRLTSRNVKLQQVHPMSSTCQHFVHCVNGMTWRRQIPPANGSLDCKCDDFNIVFPSSHLHTFHPSFIFTLLLSTMSPLPLSLLFSAFRHVVLC